MERFPFLFYFIFLRGGGRGVSKREDPICLALSRNEKIISTFGGGKRFNHMYTEKSFFEGKTNPMKYLYKNVSESCKD